MSETFHPRSIIVTGGAGFIGSNFVHWVVRERPEVHVTVLDKLTYAGRRENLNDIPAGRLDFVRGDVCDGPLLDTLLPNHDAVVHFAAESHNDWSIVDPEPFVRTNVEGTRCICEACIRHGVRLHHVSTDEVFGGLDLDSAVQFDEASPYNPTTPYAASKASSDMLVRAYATSGGLAATISNCSNNYGPRQHVEKYIPRQVTNVLCGMRPRLYGDGLNVRDWIHVEDHCSAIWAILTRGRVGESYLVGSGEDRNNLEVMHMILSIMGRPEDAFDWVRDRAGHDRRYAIDSTKLRTELSWNPTHIDFYEGLEATVAWYRDNEAWWRLVKEATEARYAVLGQ